MPRITNELKLALSKLSKEELEKYLLRFAAKDEEMFKILTYELVDEKTSDLDLFEESKEDIELELVTPHRGNFERALAKSIGEAVNVINNFATVTKNKKLEADLLVHLLNIIFNEYANSLGTCWTVLDTKVGMTVKRLHTLVSKRIHEDMQIDYRKDVNHFLQIIHQKSDHLDFIYNMPKELDV